MFQCLESRGSSQDVVLGGCGPCRVFDHFLQSWMECEEQPCVVTRAISSDRGSERYHQDDGGDDGDGDEQQEWLRCRSCVLACRFVPLGGGDDGWKG